MENNNKKSFSFISDIFHYKESDSNLIFPIIKNPYKIENLISFLKSKEYNINDKYEEIQKLFDLFKSNIFLIPFFIRCCKKNNLNLLYESIFDIYLNQEIQKDREYEIENILKLIMINTTLPKSAPEYLYQKMSTFFNEEKKGELNEQLFMKYLNLLHLCYKDNSLEKQQNSIKKNSFNDFEEIEDVQKKTETKNYIYFNGINSSLTFKINNNSNSSNAFPSIENGLSFVFWINLDKNLLINYNTIYNLDNNPLKINLILMNVAEHQIKFVFKDNKFFQLAIDKTESKLIDVSTIFTFGKWINVCFIITEKTFNNPRSLKVYINGVFTKCSLQIPNDFPTKIRISKIVMFENLIGRVSSVLFFSFPLEQKIILHFALHMNLGIYNNKILFKFLIANDSNYFKNSINYKYYEKYKNEKKKEKSFKILLKEKNMKNIISIFPPFTYNRRENSIDDIFGNYIAALSENDGVNIFINHIKNIQRIGGISNLLPIAELMLNSLNSNNNIISEKSTLKYITICKDIIIEHNNNLYDANKNNFFSNLGLFFERFPSNIFTQKLLNILIEIGKEVFQYNDIQNEKKKFNYVNTILLNEKIFSKFNSEDQVKLWDELYKFFTSDYSILKDSLNISKICFLLRFYDENRYNEYCCQNHANIIEINDKSSQKNNIKNIKNPEMKSKTQKLFEIIQIYISKFEEDEVILYKLLLLDLSPCLQLNIINVYINYFIGSTPDEIKKKTFINLLKNDYFEITEYLLTVSLLDVRVEIFKLMKIIFQIYRSTISEFYKTKEKKDLIDAIFYYIRHNILLDNLLVEIEKDKKYKDDKDYISIKKINQLPLSLRKRRSISPLGLNKKINRYKNSFYEKNFIYKDIIPLIKFINKDIYNEQKESLWRLLSSWIIYENEKKNLKINRFAIKFCLLFVQKNKIKYTAEFLSILIAYFNDNSIVNSKDIYSDNKLFSWIIEIIFYYHNKENIRNIDNKKEEMHINNIQKKTFEILKFFLGNKYVSQEQFEQNLTFIYDYSLYIKNKVDEENIQEFEKKHKKNEISRITGVLLLLCLESFTQNIDFMTKICFRFLIYYKNCLISINKDIQKNNIDNLSNDSNESDDSFEIVEKPLVKKKSIIIINNNINLIDKENKSQKFNNNKESLIPTYILEGINYDPFQFENEDEENEKEEISNFNNLRINQSICNYHIPILLNEDENNIKNKIKKNVLLKEIWKDFAIYDNIIDYYYSNLWGLDNLCKKIKIEYDNNPIELIKKLYQEYSTNKKYKNILLEPILECFNIKNNNSNDNKIESVNSSNNNKSKFNSDIKNNRNSNSTNSIFNEEINILKINLILLSIAVEITNDQVQKEFLENQYQQFIIFCILASINIKQNEKHYNLIQNKLYDILGYGCIFLKNVNETKYQQIFNYLINPIFKEINEVGDNKGFKKMFGFTKKKLYSSTAAFKVFSSNESKILLKSLTIKSDSGNKNSHSLRCNSFDDISSIIGSKLNLDDDEQNDLFNEKKKNSNKKKSDEIKDFSDIDSKSFEIMPELRVDKERRIDAIFTNIQDQYKKLDSKTSENIKKIITININEELLKKEKKRVFNKIKQLIPNYSDILQKYSNTSNIFERLRKNEYKKTKIKLFSWRGFWSNKYLFFTHPEYLKLKVKNHYSREMIRPILTPIYDINYYFPKFKLFQKEKIFNQNNYNYNINLDIDEILKEKNKLNNINYKELFNPIKNNFGFNYLECLYKMQDKEIWNYYKMLYQENLGMNKKNTNNLLNNSKDKNIITENKDKKNYESIESCIVKEMNHIKGYIKIKKEGFIFNYEEYEEENNFIENNNMMQNLYQEIEEDDLSYDKEMGCCYGSLFKKHKRDKEKIKFYIEYKQIKYFFIRNYYYRDTAVEIFTELNKSYFFNFKSKEDLSLFISGITENSSEIKFRQIYEDKTKKKIGYEKILPSMKNKSYSISSKIEEWQNYNISTLEYLMWLNIYSGRSFNDLNQYPVFPWIISNYSTDNISKDNFRDLSQPIGMIDLNEKSINRKNAFINFYETIKNNLEESNPDFDYQNFLNKGQEYLMLYKKKKLKMMKKDKNQSNYEDTYDISYTQIPYFYGTHYSNPTYVSHYLVRVFPFSFISIEIHGTKFDDAERMFFSIEKTFESVSTLKDDIREIIPEFYFLPEMFENFNNLNLAQNRFDSEGKEVIINNVELPPWAKNSSINFVLEMRKYLESNEININKWIDIIFGSYQRGENAEKINNIFMSYTYENMIQIKEIKNYDQRCALLRLFETGVTPRLLFRIDSKARLESSAFIQKISNSNLHFLEESIILDRNNRPLKNYDLLFSINEKELKKKISPKITKIVFLNNENLRFFSDTNQYFNFKIKKEKNEKKEDKKANDEKKIYNIENTSSMYAASYQISSIETPIIIYNNNKLMIKGGFWDGRLEINSLQNDIKEEKFASMIFQDYSQPIVCMEMSEQENLLICGTIDGAIIVYDVKEKNLIIKDIIYSHSDEITSISINDNLNMFATTSVDGYIMIHVLPTLQLVRSIHISSYNPKLFKNNQNIINDNRIIEESEKNDVKEQISTIINNKENNSNEIIENSENEKKDKNEIIENIEMSKIIENNGLENYNNNDKIKEELFEEYKEQKCLYANNVFLSSCPLSSIVVFIQEANIFRTYTINGKFINETEETDNSSKIYSPIIYKNIINFHEFLIYGTNNGYIKIRAFPKMNLINKIKFYEDCEIKSLALSNDKKYCYSWAQGNILSVISDNIIADFQEL